MAETGQAQHMPFANTLRGVAAICVVFQHYFVGYWSVPVTIGSLLHVPPDLTTGVPSYLEALAPPYPFAWGAFGVALFFLVSGFVIPFSLVKLSGAAFLIGRFFRIFPVYAVGFSISLAALWLVGKYFISAWSLEPADIALHYFPGLRDVAGVAGIDGIIWTLDIEIKFYLICALGAPLFRHPGVRLLALPLIVGLGSLLLSVALLATSDRLPVVATLSFDLAHIVFMFIGTTLYLLHVGGLRALSAAAIVGGLVFCYAFLLLIGPYPQEVLNACNYGVAVVIFALAYRFRRAFGSHLLTDFFAAISYPLYAVHAIVGWAILRMLSDNGVPPWVALVFVTPFSIVLAWIVHRAVEQPSHKAGRLLSGQLDQLLTQRLRAGQPLMSESTGQS